MNRPKLLWAVVYVLTAVIAYRLGYNYAKSVVEQQVVFDVCQESRMSSLIPEYQCAHLQDKYHIEFLCKHNNRLVSNTCWTERNKAVQ